MWNSVKGERARLPCPLSNTWCEGWKKGDRPGGGRRGTQSAKEMLITAQLSRISLIYRLLRDAEAAFLSLEIAGDLPLHYFARGVDEFWERDMRETIGMDERRKKQGCIGGAALPAACFRDTSIDSQSVLVFYNRTKKQKLQFKQKHSAVKIVFVRQYLMKSIDKHSTIV